jgi:hypothetical protein
MLTDDKDVQHAVDIYKGRIFPEERIRQFMAQSERPHQFCRIKPDLFVLFDAVNFPDDPRREWQPDL